MATRGKPVRYQRKFWVTEAGWEKIRYAALAAGVPVSVFVREAVFERIEREFTCTPQTSSST
ncbi:MAG: hypothetical protein ACYTFI_00865 [Planctomycetota bacterium]|jgi:hypothetical protein